MEELETLIKPLDVEPDLQRGQQVKTFALKNADPFVVQDAITKLYRPSGRGGSDQVSAVADYSRNAVIVSASFANMKRIEAFIAEAEAAEGMQQEVHVINLENAEAEAVSRTLTEIFVRAAQQRGGGVPPVSISAVQGSRAILVKCNAEDFAKIDAIVADLDREDTMTGEEVRVVTLLYSDATEMQNSLKESLAPPGGAGGRAARLAGNVRISVLTQGNALVISGSKSEVDRLEARVAELDEASKVGSGGPQMIALKHARVGQILPTVQELFAEQRGGGGRRTQAPPLITGDEITNSLIVRASPTDLAAIQAVVEQLDTEEAGKREDVRLIQVSAGINVTDLAEKLEESINKSASARSGKGRGGQAPSITVMPDTRTTSLIVSGDRTLFDETERVAQALMSMGPSGGKSTAIIQIDNVAGDDIERLILQLKGEDTSGKSRPSRSGTGTRGKSPRRPGG
jgi:type II secretory pathway component GspD/PulD (secretin)